MDESSKFLSLNAFQNKYNMQAPPLKIILWYMYNLGNQLYTKTDGGKTGWLWSFISKLMEMPKSSKLVYKKLVLSKSENQNKAKKNGTKK